MYKNIKKEVIWKIREYGSMLYNVRTQEKIKLNQMATKIFLFHFVDRYNINFITDELSQQYPEIDRTIIKDDVVEVLDLINNSEMIVGSEENRGFVNLIEPFEQLDYVSIQITKRCNLNCIHCLEKGNVVTQELSYEEACKIINELSEYKVLEIVWTGGEPLMRNDLIDLVEYATKKNIKSVIFTNGCLVDEKFISSIKDKNVFLRFSLDGATKEINDKIRGNGSYETIINAINKCKKNGIEIGIATTINKMNFMEKEQIVELAESLNVDEIELSEVEERGYAITNKGKLLLSQQQKYEFREFSLLLTIQNEKYRKGIRFQKYSKILSEGDKKHCCKGGITTAFINIEGNLYPCYLFSNYKEAKVSNVLKESIISSWQTSDFLDRLRNISINDLIECTKCDCLAHCSGGCRAVAYENTGSLTGLMTGDFCNTTKYVINKYNIN